MTREAGVAPALAAFDAGDLPRLLELRGLPAETPLAAVADALGADPARYARHFLGEPLREAFWCVASRAGFGGDVRIWFAQRVVLKVEGQLPSLSPEELSGLIAAAGPGPEVRPSPDGSEYVWADRGVSVTTDGESVTRLAIFPPTSMAEYERSLSAFD